MKNLSKFIFIVVFFLIGVSSQAGNRVELKKSVALDLVKDSLRMSYRGIDNMDEKTTLHYRITSENLPFEIYKVELKAKGKLYQPLEPFTMSVLPAEVSGKRMVWEVWNEFPMLTSFSSSNVLLVHTDKGIMEIPASSMGVMKKYMGRQKAYYEKRIDQSDKAKEQAWTILLVVSGVLLLSFALGYWVMTVRIRRRKEEMEMMTMLIAERTEKNEKLQQMVDDLYNERLETLNMLCNEYFEKSESEKIRLTLFNEVEKHILDLRNRKSVEALEKVVNTYLDNILLKLREQLPNLSQSDLTFITYLYAGFSPRAICIFTDIKVKNFYNKRSRLKEKILASEAPDKEWFASKM